jgi:hypothetical protein
MASPKRLAIFFATVVVFVVVVANSCFWHEPTERFRRFPSLEMTGVGWDSDTQGDTIMRPTPQSIPISQLRQESGAQDLVRSEKMKPYLELLKAHIGGQDTAPYLAALAELPLEERYVWRVISALKWAFCDLETENVLADLETLGEDDLKLVSEPLAIRAMQFALFAKALLGQESAEQIMLRATRILKESNEQ